jgi:hypothetical protein
MEEDSSGRLLTEQHWYGGTSRGWPLAARYSQALSRKRSRVRGTANPEVASATSLDNLFSGLGIVVTKQHLGTQIGVFHMRYFFHLANGHEAIPDDTGLELIDLETGKAQALQVISELREEVGTAPEDWASWQLDIASPEGHRLHSICLATVLQ